MTKNQYLSAQEAADELDISLATLYSYVSRGLVRSEAVGGAEGGQKRTRRYRMEDVQRLKERKEQQRDPDIVAERALYLGAPIMDSAITLITDDHFYYRGYDVTQLARTCSLEQVATLIWMGTLPAPDEPFFGPRQLSPRYQVMLRQLSNLSPLEAFQVLLPLVAIDDIAAYDLRPSAVAQMGAHILRMLAAIAVREQPTRLSIAQMLQRGWAPADPRAAELINTALILAADHELNVATFAARCVASAAATPYDVVIAGLAAFQGRQYAGYAGRIEAFVREAATPEGVRPAIIDRMKRGEVAPVYGGRPDSERKGELIPGFGSFLYPSVDPRAEALLQLLVTLYPDTPAIELAKVAVEEVYAVLGEHPNIDFALVMLSHVLQLPRGASIALFALGRMVGWIGHAIEQYQTNQVIRPRARYIGDSPVESPAQAQG